MSRRAIISKKSLARSVVATGEITFLQTDAGGIIVSACDQLAEYTGNSIKSLVGSSLIDIASEKSKGKLAAFLKKEKVPGLEIFSFTLKGQKRNRSIEFSVERIAGASDRNFLLNWYTQIKKANSADPGSLSIIRQMFGENSQAVFVLDDHAIVYANAAAGVHLGYSEAEFSELRFSELLGSSTQNEYSVGSGLRKLRSRDGALIQTEIFMSTVKISGKEYQIVFATPSVQIIHSVPQVTGENSSVIFDSDAWQILDQAPEVFFKLDADGNFIFVSKEFETLLGFSKAEIYGRNFSSIVFPPDLEIAQQGFADIFQFGRAKGNVVFRVLRSNGESLWVSTSGVFVFDEEGKPVYCIGVAQNITEMKQLVEKLEASEERYAAFINHSSEAIWRFETTEPLSINLPEDILISEFLGKGFLAECNDEMAKLYGFAEACDITGAPLSRFISPEDTSTLDYFRGFVQSGFKLVNVETYETDRDGNPKIFLNNLLGIVEQDHLVRVWGTQRDITAHKLAEQRAKELLEQSENFFKTLISDARDGIIVLDRDGCIKYAAESITNVLGYLPEEVIGTKCFDFIHPDDLPAAHEGFEKVTSVSNSFVEMRFRSKPGEWLWMLVRANNLYNQPAVSGLVVYFTDITHRKHTENIVKESEKRFRHLADTVPVMIWVSDENNKSTYISKYWTDFTGINLDKIVADGWKGVIHPEDHHTAITQYNTSFLKREPFVNEYRVKSRDGEYKWVLDHAVPRFAPDGVFLGYIGSVTDIHYRKTAEQKLRYQASIFENIQDAIVSTDLNFIVNAWNVTAEEIYGLTKEEVMGKHIRSLIRLEYLSISREAVMIELYEKDSWEGEVYFDRKDGKRIYLSCSLSFVKNSRGERVGLVGIQRDITQRYEAEMALRISEERYRSVVDALNEGIILQDNQGKMIASNRSANGILGKDLVGSQFKLLDWRCISEDGLQITADKDPFTITLKTGKPLQGLIIGLQIPGNSFGWYSVNTEPIYYTADRTFPDAVVTSLFDITQRKHQEQWLSLEKEVLELNASPTGTLKTTVDFYLKGIEKMFPDMVCSILMLRDDKKTIEHLSAPSMPADFSEAINGATIGPKAGSCGTAIFLKQRVITNDINRDLLWEDYRDLAAKYNLQSCWSFPILNSQKEVIATIAVYHHYPKVPGNKELSLMEVACNLLRVIIENKKSEANLRLSNERYLLATKATHDAIYDWDINQNTVYRGESFYTLFGYHRNQVSGLLPLLEEKLHPDDRNRVVRSLKRFIDNKSPDIWESEYKFLNASGRYVVVYDRGFLIFNHEGKPTRLVGSMMDITERKELEKRLVKQEVDRQKMIAQAVVNAQEKERAEIGKELHDNVNQILSTARLYLELATNDENQRINLIKRSYDNIYDAINEIRSISRSLVPPSVGDLGLIESIEDLVENIRATKMLYIEFYHGGEIDKLLGQKQKLMLFRIIQEQVNNVLKHANAKNIVIELMIDGHMINLAVGDDGKGFDFEQVKNNKGVGLQNIASRTELFNGKINIVTAPNKGCKLNIHVPISKL